MLLFDFVNPYVTYVFGLSVFAFSLWCIFYRKDFINRHKSKIIKIAMVLLIWTQIARYIGLFYNETTEWSFWIFNFRIIAFNWASHLPFYVCRLSVVVLLYYTITKDKKVESFLFYWGATGLAGVLYPNSSDIYNIFTLTETFYIDHYLLAITPFFLVVYQGYKPSMFDALIIALVMFVILSMFIPLNSMISSWMGVEESFVDYFYLNNQSIVGELSISLLGKRLPSIVFALLHSLVAYVFFSIYYIGFKNKEFEV